MYVRLNDKGSIFHDMSQDVTLTGANPVNVKSTKRVKDAIKSGVLIEVEDKEAKTLLASNKAEASKTASDKTLEAQLAEANKRADEAEGKVADAESALATALEEKKEVEAQLEEANAKVEELTKAPVEAEKVVVEGTETGDKPAEDAKAANAAAPKGGADKK